jgi:hypothetical protein
MNGRLAHWLTAHRYRLAIISVLVTLAAGFGLTHASFQTGYRIFFAPDNPFLQAHDYIEDSFTESDTLSLIVASREGSLFQPHILQALEEMTADGWQVPYSMRVDSLVNYQHTWADGDELVVEPLFEDSASMSAAEIERRRQVALSEPTLVNSLVNPQGSVTLVNVTLQLPVAAGNEGERDRELVNHARALKTQYETAYPDLEIHVFGQVTINNAFNEMTEDDMGVLFPLMFLILFLALLVLLLLAGLSALGALLSATSVMIVIGASTAVAMGMAGWLGMSFNAVNAIAPTIILTIAVADCVHILFSYLNGRRAGEDSTTAIRESLDINLQPVFLTSLTTAVGFLALNFSDTPPMHSLGTLTAIGIMAAFFLAVMLLPALTTLLSLKPRGSVHERSHLMARFGDRVLRHQRLFFWGTLAVTVLALTGLNRNSLNDSTFTYFDETVEFWVSANFFEDNLSGFDLISYSLDSGEASGINDPAFLNDVDRFVSWLEQQEGVAHVGSYIPVIKRLNSNLHGDDPDWYRIPETRQQASQYLLLYEMSLPYGLDLNTQLDTDRSALRIDIRIRKRKPHELIAMEKRFSDWLATETPALEATPGSSVSIMFAHMGQRNIESMFIGNAVAILLITLILIVALRSLRYGLLSILPNAIPALVTIGLWGYVDGEVNLAVALIFVITLGIVVDDTVHFLSKYLRARRQQGLSPHDAIRYAFSTVGNALVITSIVLAAGFLVLAQSHFQVNAIMGLLVAITIFVALAFDFLFLPPLLARIDRGDQARKEEK